MKSGPARSDNGGGRLPPPNAPRLKACGQPPRGQAPSAQPRSQSSEPCDRSPTLGPQGRKLRPRGSEACARKAFCLATGLGTLRAQLRTRLAEPRALRTTLSALPSQASDPCDQAGELARKVRSFAVGNRRIARVAERLAQPSADYCAYTTVLVRGVDKTKCQAVRQIRNPYNRSPQCRKTVS